MKTYFKNPNPTPGAGTFFTDAEVHLPSPVSMIALVSANPLAHLYFHTMPVNAGSQGGLITLTGNEALIPMIGSEPNYPVLKFKCPIQSFYMTGDNGSGVNPDFMLLCTDDMEVQVQFEQGLTPFNLPLPVIVENIPLGVAITGQPIAVTIPTPVPVTGPLTDAELAARLPLGIDLQKQNSVALSSPIADAPVGTETAPVVRDIQRKKTTIETTATLLANAVFTGPWHDSELDGTIYVTAHSLSDKAGASFSIQVSDDTSVAAFTRPIATSFGAPAANTLTKLQGPILARYWRVIYTNGAADQGTFKVTTCAMSFVVPGFQPSSSTGNQQATTPASSPLGNYATGGKDGDGATGFVYILASDGTNAMMASPASVYGGSFSGTGGAGQGWNRRRTPTIFKTTRATAAGNTAIWTPGAGNKFRLLRVLIELTNNASLVVAGVLTISLQDSASAMPIAIDVFVPVAAGGIAGDALHTGVIDLGDFGIISAAANNVLNINLSAALATGVVRVIAMGTEE